MLHVFVSDDLHKLSGCYEGLTYSSWGYFSALFDSDGRIEIEVFHRLHIELAYKAAFLFNCLLGICHSFCICFVFLTALSIPPPRVG